MAKTAKKAKHAKQAKRAARRKLVDDLVARQEQTTVALEALTGAVQKLPTAPSGDVIDACRHMLDDVLVAQQRTNQLLELALRAGFDDDERARGA